MRLHPIVSLPGALLAAVLLLACPGIDPITDIPNAPGGNPIAPDVAMFPFPSDLFLQEDTSTRTGYSISIPPAALPGTLVPETFAGIDGWPRSPVIMTWFPEGVDPSSLPDPLAVDATMGADSSVFVVREGDFAKVPVIVELDATATDDEQRALLIRPHVALDADTNYVVILRDSIRTADGSGSPAPSIAFEALRDGLPTTHDKVEAQRDEFEIVNAAIAGLELDPTEVIQAWTFHTRSQEQVVTPLLSMADAMMDADLGTVVIDSNEVIGDNRQVRGHFSAPNFINAGGLIGTDANDRAVQEGEEDIPFLITVPVTVDEPRPIILYGHGFFSNKEETTRSLQTLLQPHRFSAVAPNFLGFNSDQENETIGLLADFNRTAEISAMQMQSEANFVALARVIREQLGPLVNEDRGAGSFEPLDTSRVVYMGISNGGTQGLTIMSIAPNLDRGVLVVPGGGIVHMLQRAEQWTELGSIFENQFNDSRDLQVSAALLQLNLDGWDSMNFVDHLVGKRFDGRNAAKVVLHEAVNDTQVSNFVTHALARTAGIPAFSPNTLEPWGVDTIPAAEHMGDAALYIYDEGYDDLPVDNTPPAGNDAHGSVRSLDAYNQHVADFIFEDRITYVCDGACDPE